MILTPEIGTQSSSMKEVDAYNPRMGVLGQCIGPESRLFRRSGTDFFPSLLK